MLVLIINSLNHVITSGCFFSVKDSISLIFKPNYIISFSASADFRFVTLSSYLSKYTLNVVPYEPVPLFLKITRPSLYLKIKPWFND